MEGGGQAETVQQGGYCWSTAGQRPLLEGAAGSPRWQACKIAMMSKAWQACTDREGACGHGDG